MEKARSHARRSGKSQPTAAWLALLQSCNLSWMGTCLCWHDTGCGAGSYPTLSVSAASNLGGTASTFRAKPGCTVLLKNLAMSCAGRRLTPQRQKMMALLLLL